jgi:hypothetical protein
MLKVVRLCVHPIMPNATFKICKDSGLSIIFLQGEALFTAVEKRFSFLKYAV